MARKKKNKHSEFFEELSDFKKNLLFEDAGTVLAKTYRWLRSKENIEGFGVDIEMDSSTINAYVRFSKNDVVAVTLFEGGA